ncbi:MULTISPECIES: pilus assembly protein PilX [unclassified Pseudoalteromonas]|uniref:pilus assembly protein PilX n=1 Tax=unclassified Pseudoalteromonas TaxID=194690 RepID=UPI002096AF99|nr:pilus assembly protein PilX [Pseudoalteromonas sp. XMcav2-N]MCO7186977.1 pilus assembly protein PilX [Pseudoalteromonas sp. XMcav2-N]
MVMAHKQQGMVLIVSMVLIVAVLSVAVTLMSSSTIDIKVTNAAQEREAAEALLMGEVQRIISQEKVLFDASVFHARNGQFENDAGEMVGRVIRNDEEMELESLQANLNSGQLLLECPRVFNFTAAVGCVITEVESTVQYGDQAQHQVTVVIGVAQEALNIQGNQ